MRLSITSKEARITVLHGDNVHEDEVWKFDRKVSRTEAKQLAKVAFDDWYDLLNYSAHGDASNDS